MLQVFDSKTTLHYASGAEPPRDWVEYVTNFAKYSNTDFVDFELAYQHVEDAIGRVPTRATALNQEDDAKHSALLAGIEGSRIMIGKGSLRVQVQRASFKLQIEPSTGEWSITLQKGVAITGDATIKRGGGSMRLAPKISPSSHHWAMEDSNTFMSLVDNNNEAGDEGGDGLDVDGNNGGDVQMKDEAEAEGEASTVGGPAAVAGGAASPVEADDPDVSMDGT